MVAAVTPPTTISPHGSGTIPVTGATASTAYEAVITWGSGRTQIIPFTTDGSGAASITGVSPSGEDRGQYTVTIRPSLKVAVTTVSATGKVV
jgi:hypothetical protein